MVSTILVARLNTELSLFGDRLPELFSRGANEISIEKINSVLSECVAHALPGLQIVANRCGLCLLFKRARALNMRSVDLHAGLRDRNARSQHEPCCDDCSTPEH